MKNYIILSFLFLLVSCATAQVNLNQQAVIRPNRNNFVTVLQNGAAKRMNEGELRDSIQAPLNVQINLKANQVALSDTALQLRSDLATKSQVQGLPLNYNVFTDNSNQETGLKYDTLKWGAWKYLYGIQTQDATYSAGVGVFRGMYGGQSRRVGLFSKYDNTISEITAEGGYANLKGDTEISSQSGSTYHRVTPNEVVASGNSSFQGFKYNGNYSANFTDNSIPNRLYNDGRYGMRDTSIALRASLNSEIDARVAGDSIKMNKSDSTKFWRNNIEKILTSTSSQNSIISNTRVTTQTGTFYSDVATYNYKNYFGLNVDSAFVDQNNTNYSFIGQWTDSSPLTSDFCRTNFVNNSPTLLKGRGRLFQSTSGQIAYNLWRMRSSIDSLPQASFSINTLFPRGKLLSFGNGEGIEFAYLNNLSVWRKTGIDFYNQLNQDTIDWSRNPQKGHLISVRDSGALFVKARDGNNISAYDKVLTTATQKKTYTVQINSIGTTLTAPQVATMAIIPDEAVGGILREVKIYYYTPSASASDIVNYQFAQTEGGSYSAAAENLNASTRFAKLTPNLTITSNNVFSMIINSVSGNTSGRLTATLVIEK